MILQAIKMDNNYSIEITCDIDNDISEINMDYDGCWHDDRFEALGVEQCYLFEIIKRIRFMDGDCLIQDIDKFNWLRQTLCSIKTIEFCRCNMEFINSVFKEIKNQTKQNKKMAQLQVLKMESVHGDEEMQKFCTFFCVFIIANSHFILTP